MPTPINGSETARKRRSRGEHSEGTKKRRMVAQDSSPGLNIEDEILALEGKILESRSNYNSIQTLLEYVRAPCIGVDSNDVLAAVALCRVFCRLMAAGNLTKSQRNSDNEVIIVQWLRERLKEYENDLLRMLFVGDVARHSTALTLLMRLVIDEASHLNKSEEGIWRDGLFPKIVLTMVENNVASQITLEFVGKYLKKHADIRYHTFASLA